MNSIKNIVKNNDFFIGCFMIAAAIFTLWQTSKITVEQSRIVPYLIIFIMTLSGASLILSSLKSGKGEMKKLGFKKREIIMFLILITTYILIEILGFYTSLFLFINACYLFIEGSRSKKAIAKSLIFSSILIVTLYAGFSVVLNMTTPGGLLI